MKEGIKDIFELNKKEESIFGIIGRMETLVNYFESVKKYSGLIGFLKTYLAVTQKVEAKYVKKSDYYLNIKKLEQVDIEFASLYFKALKSYLISEKKLSPWKEYFNYCEEGGGWYFLQMLLGIHVHINADLCVTLVNLNYKVRKDFLVINKILEELIPGIMFDLAFHKQDIFGFGGVVFRDFVKKEFNKIVVGWRLQAWKNAQVLRKNPKKKRELHQKTEQMTLELIKLFDDAMHLKNVFEFIGKLEEMKVEI